MNVRIILKVVGLFTAAIALSMALALGWALADGTPDRMPLVWGILAGTGLGLGLWLPNRRVRWDIQRREGFAIVTLSWVLAALVGAIPFYLHPGGAFPSFLDAYFESMSGFTTTGASIIQDIEALPRGLLFWRSLTHWLGGMGIIFLLVALLPVPGMSGRILFRSEAASVESYGLAIRIRQAARRLWLIYAGATILETLLLRLAGLDWWNAICESFGSIATGGFSVHNGSIAAYRSPVVEAIIIVFMLVGAANFALYYQGLMGRWKSMFRDGELRVYLGVAVVLVAALTGILLVSEPEAGAWDALRRASFNGVSILTCTGFATSNTDTWPATTHLLLMGAMAAGGCTGSTAGGLKIFRVAVLAKVMWRGLMRAYRPHEVRALYFGGKPLDDGMTKGIVALALLALAVCFLASLILLSTGLDLETSVSAVLANLCTAGPGFGQVGSMANYSHLLPAAKITLVGCQLMGRLELVTVLVLLIPGFWGTAGLSLR